MAAESWVSLPKLEDDSKDKDWKRELKIWQALTELESEKQGPAVFMILEDKAKEAVSKLESTRVAVPMVLKLLLIG